MKSVGVDRFVVDLQDHAKARRLERRAANLHASVANGRGNPEALAAALEELTLALELLTKRDQALELQEQALRLRRMLAERGHAEQRDKLAGALNTLGLLHHWRGDAQGALRFSDESVAIRRELAPQGIDYAESFLKSSIDQSRLYISLGDPQTALQVANHARPRTITAIRTSDPLRGRIAMCKLARHTAVCLRLVGDREDAVRTARIAMKAWYDAVALNPRLRTPTPVEQELFAQLLSTWGFANLAVGDFERARMSSGYCLETQRELAQRMPRLYGAWDALALHSAFLERLNLREESRRYLADAVAALAGVRQPLRAPLARYAANLKAKLALRTDEWVAASPRTAPGR